MSRRDQILVEHRAAIRSAAGRRRACSIALVGSVARGDDSKDSDFDFLVQFEDGADLFDLSGLRLDLEEILGRPVDVVPRSGVRDSHRSMFDDEIPL